MNITTKQLTALGACSEGIAFVKKQKDKSLRSLVGKALDVNPAWIHWLLPRLMTHPQRVLYAVHSAELCLAEFEKKFPKGDRPRKAIEAAKAFVLNPTKENWSAESAARSAESAARSAARSVWSAKSAAWSAESAAWSAESAAWSAESAA